MSRATCPHSDDKAHDGDRFVLYKVLPHSCPCWGRKERVASSQRSEVGQLVHSWSRRSHLPEKALGPLLGTPVPAPWGFVLAQNLGSVQVPLVPPGVSHAPRAPFPEGRALSWRLWGWALGAGGTEELGRSGLTGRRSPFRVWFFFLLLLLRLRGST